MNERQRTILRQVAEGRLSPDEAAALLDQTEQDEQDERSEATERGDETGREKAADGGGLPGGQSPPPGPGAEGAVRRVRVVGTFGSARIIGDPTVHELFADGPHLARREGDLLVIESRLDESELPGFVFNPARWGWPADVVADVPGPWRWPRPPRPPRPGRWSGMTWQGPRGQRQLTVRMRPDLPLEVQLSAGSLRVYGVTGPLDFEVRAGSARIDGAHGPLDATVTAGSLRVEAMLRSGRSRIRCEAGSARVHLEHGSSVLVRARAELSKLSLPHRGTSSWATLEDEAPGEEIKIGDGEARLDIDATMSSIEVTADQ
jgi:hypothetical protein